MHKVLKKLEAVVSIGLKAIFLPGKEAAAMIENGSQEFGKVIQIDEDKIQLCLIHETFPDRLREFSNWKKRTRGKRKPDLLPFLYFGFLFC